MLYYLIHLKQKKNLWTLVSLALFWAMLPTDGQNTSKQNYQLLKLQKLRCAIL